MEVAQWQIGEDCYCINKRGAQLVERNQYLEALSISGSHGRDDQC